MRSATTLRIPVIFAMVSPSISSALPPAAAVDFTSAAFAAAGALTAFAASAAAMISALMILPEVPLPFMPAKSVIPSFAAVFLASGDMRMRVPSAAAGAFCTDAAAAISTASVLFSSVAGAFAHEALPTVSPGCPTYARIPFTGISSPSSATILSRIPSCSD